MNVRRRIERLEQEAGLERGGRIVLALDVGDAMIVDGVRIPKEEYDASGEVLDLTSPPWVPGGNEGIMKV